jgi:ubiquinone/menaquinone biosynthesis C-methylase UbiE
MLDQCRKKAVIAGYREDRIEFRQVDAEFLPFNANSFDAVISGMMLGLVSGQEKVLAEMKRVVRPGGMVALSTHGLEHD